ncbi:MAG: hypothetical protein J7K51_09590 [Thermotogae bacterium]|nr:hypothetical protein [Thermotogota bacterium]
MKTKPLTKEQVRKFIKENDIGSMDDVEDIFKDMFKMVLEEMLNAELDEKGLYRKNLTNPNIRKSANKLHGFYPLFGF